MNDNYDWIDPAYRSYCENNDEIRQLIDELHIADNYLSRRTFNVLCGLNDDDWKEIRKLLDANNMTK